MVLEVIEQVAGMVGGILEFPLTGMFGRLLPAGGSKAGQQVGIHSRMHSPSGCSTVDLRPEEMACAMFVSHNK